MRLKRLGIFSAMLLTCLAACEPAPELPRYDTVVVWASYEDETYLPKLFAEFTAETRVPVTVKYAKGDLHLYNLIENIGSEPADVFLSRSIADLWQAADEGALRPIQASNLENVPAALKDGDDLWTAINYQASVIVHGSDSQDVPSLSFSELADEAFKNRVCLSTSRLSTNLEIVAMLSAEISTKPAERVVRGWVSNLAKAPFRTEELLLAAIAGGECEFGVLSGWAAAAIESNADSNLKMIRPEPPFNQIEGVGVGRHSRNPQSAHVLVNWLLSDQPNKAHAGKIGAYAVSDGRYLNLSGQPVGVAGWRRDESKLLVERASYR